MAGRRSQFGVLFRAFFAQFFASESVTSDIQLRQTIIWVLAFLLAPGLLILMFVFPTYQMVVIRVKALHAPPRRQRGRSRPLRRDRGFDRRWQRHPSVRLRPG